MKKTVSLLLALLLTVSIVAAASWGPIRNYKVKTCTDSDSWFGYRGLNIFEQGTLEMTSYKNPSVTGKVTDKCKDSTHLYEGICKKFGTPWKGQFYEVDCSYLGMVCVEGACVMDY